MLKLSFLVHNVGPAKFLVKYFAIQLYLIRYYMGQIGRIRFGCLKLRDMLRYHTVKTVIYSKGLFFLLNQYRNEGF